MRDDFSSSVQPSVEDYVDGVLTASASKRFEADLLTNAELQKEVTAYRSYTQAMSGLKLGVPIGQGLMEATWPTKRPVARTHFQKQLLAASLLCVVALSAAYFSINSFSGIPMLEIPTLTVSAKTPDRKVQDWIAKESNIRFPLLQRSESVNLTQVRRYPEWAEYRYEIEGKELLFTVSLIRATFSEDAQECGVGVSPEDNANALGWYDKEYSYVITGGTDEDRKKLQASLKKLKESK